MLVPKVKDGSYREPNPNACQKKPTIGWQKDQKKRNDAGSNHQSGTAFEGKPAHELSWIHLALRPLSHCIATQIMCHLGANIACEERANMR
jgi:hypothetical protein